MESNAGKIKTIFLWALAIPVAALAVILFNAQQGLRAPAIFFEIGGIATLVLGAGAATMATILRINEESGSMGD